MITYLLNEEMIQKMKAGKLVVVNASMTKTNKLIVEVEDSDTKKILRLSFSDPVVSNADFEIIGSRLIELVIYKFTRFYNTQYFESKIGSFTWPETQQVANIQGGN